MPKLVPGFNDLATTHPEIAKEAHDWDPSTVTPGTKSKREWKCSKGHIYKAACFARTRPNATGCPKCSGLVPIRGTNDLATTHPEIAKEAHGWDPSTVKAGSGYECEWMCAKGHVYSATCNNRTKRKGTGCPYCAGKKVFAGFNDLATKHPEVAMEAYGWDPSTVTAAGHTKREWKCSKGHIYQAACAARTKPNGTGCPDCAAFGYTKNKEGFIYLMERPGEQQVGISNVPMQRVGQHERYGWILVELAGPFDGAAAWDRERDLKDWLRDSIGTIAGTTENWDARRLMVRSLAELYERAGLPCEILSGDGCMPKPCGGLSVTARA